MYEHPTLHTPLTLIVLGTVMGFVAAEVDTYIAWATAIVTFLIGAFALIDWAVADRYRD